MKFSYEIKETNLPKWVYTKFAKEKELSKDSSDLNNRLQTYAEILSCEAGWMPITLELRGV